MDEDKLTTWIGVNLLAIDKERVYFITDAVERKECGFCIESKGNFGHSCIVNGVLDKANMRVVADRSCLYAVEPAISSYLTQSCGDIIIVANILDSQRKIIHYFPQVLAMLIQTSLSLQLSYCTFVHINLIIQSIINWLQILIEKLEFLIAKLTT